MKKITIIFWIITVIFCVFMLFSAYEEIINAPDSKALMTHLGYPDYFNQFIGIAKLLGVIAIIIPGFPRLKEWAYAGFFFDLIGATYSGIATDGFKPQISFMVLPILLLFISYYYFHKRIEKSKVGAVM
ncbi:MAG TPA: DoxX family protein [Puia sp.]|nr:DoxX family protein [Puia sp.]